MSLSAFMAQNVVQEENIKYVVSKRFIDEETKKAIAWELKCLDSQSHALRKSKLWEEKDNTQKKLILINM